MILVYENHKFDSYQYYLDQTIKINFINIAIQIIQTKDREVTCHSLKSDKKTTTLVRIWTHDSLIT